MFESEGAKVLDKDQGTKVGYTDPGYPSWGTQTRGTRPGVPRPRIPIPEVHGLGVFALIL